jgi:uncharacterized protein with GYD domain
VKVREFADTARPNPDERGCKGVWDKPPGGGEMYTYVGLITLTDEGRENLEKAPEYLEKFKHIVEVEGGKLDRILAVMGPWDFVVLVQYPDIETAFRVLAKIGTLEVIKTETFPAEDVEIFLKALV